MIFEVVCCALAVYCSSSFVLFRFPELIHGTKKRSKQADNTEAIDQDDERPSTDMPTCFHISHRGGAAESLENTMTAFDHATAAGTEMFELDCHITKDGQVVVCHDNNLSRLCGEDIRICETNFDDLPLILLTQRLDFNRKTIITHKTSDRKILLLEDLLIKYPNMPMNIDIKIRDESLITEVSKLLKKYNRDHISVVGNSNHKTSKMIRSINPTSPTLFSINEVAITVCCYWIGLLPFIPLPAHHFEIPMFTVLLEHFDFPNTTRGSIIRLMLKFADWNLTNKKLITHLKKRGIPTYMFVLNAEHEWQRAVDCGVSGIMTDYPTRLQKWRVENGFI